jgi:hypothetical protein
VPPPDPDPQLVDFPAVPAFHCPVQKAGCFPVPQSQVTVPVYFPKEPHWPVIFFHPDEVHAPLLGEDLLALPVTMLQPPPPPPPPPELGSQLMILFELSTVTSFSICKGLSDIGIPVGSQMIVSVTWYSFVDPVFKTFANWMSFTFSEVEPGSNLSFST